MKQVVNLKYNQTKRIDKKERRSFWSLLSTPIIDMLASNSRLPWWIVMRTEGPRRDFLTLTLSFFCCCWHRGEEGLESFTDFTACTKVGMLSNFEAPTKLLPSSDVGEIRRRITSHHKHREVRKESRRGHVDDLKYDQKSEFGSIRWRNYSWSRSKPSKCKKKLNSLFSNKRFFFLFLLVGLLFVASCITGRRQRCKKKINRYRLVRNGEHLPKHRTSCQCVNAL